MLIAWVGYSQIDTKKDSVALPFEVAKRIHIDLLDYDRLRTSTVETDLNNCLELLREKDSLIGYLHFKMELAEGRQQLLQKEGELFKHQLQQSRKSNSKGMLWGLVGLAVGVTTGVLILK